MDGSPPAPKPAGRRGQKSREVRLGAVMYGGVSLAIYSYGVTQELFRTVRGRGVYKLIKALTDSDVVVDVISGTSAGGINGILLAYALCNERDISSASALWRVDGDIRRLLRSPRDGLAKSTSLLDSEEYYQSRLETAFREMASYAPEEGEDPSDFSELDLFVTGTDIDGNLYTQFDDYGHQIDVKDHRTVFLLKHRKERKEPFNPQPSDGHPTTSETTYKALAKLARITSCFPAAFEPVHVTSGTGSNPPEDAKLQLWGKLGKEARFIDGGVLDNKPFTYTLKAIFSRTADRAVDRKLLYVEPDPESFAAQDTASNPNLVQVVLASLIGIPGYESISDDLKLLAERNSKLWQYQRLVKRLQPECAPPSLTPGEQRAPAVPPPDGREPAASSPMLYERSRLVFISDRVIQGLFKRGGRPDLIRPDEREKASLLIKNFDELFDKQLEATPQNIRQLFGAFDVYFRMRRAFRIVYLIYEHLNQRQPPLDPEVAQQYKEVWQAFNRQIKLYEVIQSAMEGLIDEAPFDWRTSTPEQLWGQVQTALIKLLDARADSAKLLPLAYTKQASGETQDWLPKEQLSQLNETLRKLAKSIVEEIGNTSSKEINPSTLDALTEYNSVLQLAEGYECKILAALMGPNDPIQLAYDNFEVLDKQLYPMEMLAGLHEKDVIETIRISPHDADKAFSRGSYSDKVSGDALYHFGGFFKRSWRSNDILWGRLDGLCQLIEILFTRERLIKLWDEKDTCQRIAARLRDDKALDPARLFPRAGENTQNSLRTWFQDLFSDNIEQRQNALCQKTFAEKVELLIEAAQLEIIAAELPNVITDALDEQATWNQFRIQTGDDIKRLLTSAGLDEPGSQAAQDGQSRPPPGRGATAKEAEPEVGALIYDAPSWSFRSANGRLDPLVAMTAAAEVTRAAVASFDIPGDTAGRPSNTALGRFFKQSYRVGAERLTRDIPALVLLEIVAVALLVVRNCVLSLFRENSSRIRWNPIYLVLIEVPLRTFHALVVLMRRVPGRGLYTMLTVALLSLFALGVGIVANLWIMIIGAAMILAVEIAMWLVTAGWLDRRDRRRQAAYDAASTKLNEKKYDLAIQGFHDFTRRFPTYELAGHAQFWVAKAHQERAHAFAQEGNSGLAKREREEAVKNFAQVSAKYPRCDKAPAAIYGEAITLLALERQQEARDRLQSLISKFPWTESAAQARQQLIKLE